jgi:putative ABC transport system permease protein
MPDRIYRFLLLAYPRAFRETHGAEMVGVFQECYRASRKGSLLLFWLGTVWDAISNGCLLRLSSDENGDRLAFGWSKDVRYALRQLARSPGFSLAVVLTLALGIGANTAIFSFVNALLVRPFPFANPDRLVEVYGLNGSDKSRLSMREVADLNESAKLFEEFAGYNNTGYNYSGDGGQAEHYLITRSTHNLFHVLGVMPALGSTWPAISDRSRDFQIVLTHDLWTRRFQSDPAIVGKQVLMDGYPNTVVGVAAPGFKFPVREALFRCWGIDPNPRSYEERHRRALFVVGRLKRGVSLEQGRDELAAIGQRLARDFPLTNSRIRLGMAPLRDVYTGGVRPYLLLLLGAVGFVLLIACANVANLMLARSTGRKREMAIRVALGAAKSRLVRQVLVESMVYSAIGGVIGIGIALLALRVLTQIITVELPAWMDVRIDGAVLVYMLGVTVLTSLLAGLLPAVRGARRDVQEALKQGAAGSTKPSRALKPMVTAEVAFASVLLVGAGLMMQSFARLLDVDLGFRTDHMYTFKMGLSWRKYNLERSRELARRVLEQLAQIPGVTAVATDTSLPLAPRSGGLPVRLEGQTTTAEEAANPTVALHQVSPNYHQVMGIPLLDGRQLNDLDHLSNPRVAVVSERLAKRFWPGQNPIGKRVLPADLMGPYRAVWLTVVGVVGNVRYGGPAGEVGIDLYVPYQQAGSQGPNFVVRTAVEPESIHRQVLQAVAKVDAEEPPSEMLTMDQVLNRTIWQRKLAGVVCSILAGLALLLAAIGIYGVIAYSVSQRVREIGIRTALGAARGDILLMVAAEGARFVMPGIAMGIALGLALARAVSTLLFQISPYDPITLGGVLLALILVASCACLVPALRAARVDPLLALRTD